MMVLFLTITHLFTSQDINWWTGVMWIIVMFLSAVWTLILTAPIHCRWWKVNESICLAIIALHIYYFNLARWTCWVTSWEPLLWWLKACQRCLKPSSNHTNVHPNTNSLLCQHSKWHARTHRVLHVRTVCLSGSRLHDELFKCTGGDAVVLLSVPLGHFQNFKGLETARPVNVWPSSGNTSGASCISPYHMETVIYEHYLSTDTDGVATLMFQNRSRSLFNTSRSRRYLWMTFKCILILIY